jgi:hypothetical protein
MKSIAVAGAKARHQAQRGGDNTMNRLLEIGFVHAGQWTLREDKELEVSLMRHAAQRNILYAFVTEGIVKYVGKTTRTLAERMAGYQRPGPTQATNRKNNQRIRQCLEAGLGVEILALPDSGLLRYGTFHLNLAAGLEDDIIHTLDPEWNGGGERSDASEAEATNPQQST